ncbi:hypothetical protein Tco_0890456 [Tanacetum coccineum]|uniref:Uncharacterized protein n=1 Tax=Tanacetum coccineum TaxID=301880 RepID=A0ABQ5C5K3_9ASTR
MCEVKNSFLNCGSVNFSLRDWMPAMSKQRQKRDPERSLKVILVGARTEVGQCRHGVSHVQHQPSPGERLELLTKYQKSRLIAMKTKDSVRGKIPSANKGLKDPLGYTTSSKKTESLRRISWKDIRQKTKIRKKREGNATDKRGKSLERIKPLTILMIQRGKRWPAQDFPEASSEAAISAKSKGPMVPATNTLLDFSGEETIWPLRQKKRGQAPERNKAIQEEVEKLVDAGIMKETSKILTMHVPRIVPHYRKIDWKVAVPLGLLFPVFLDAFMGYHQIKMAQRRRRKKRAFQNIAKGYFAILKCRSD